MLTTPFNTTYYYKTELLYNNQIDKINKKAIASNRENDEVLKNT
jgi:hypothetical protein